MLRSGTPRYIRIFLASPGDVARERELATDLLKNELPYDPLIVGRAIFQVVSWDDPAAPKPQLANITPQEAVNRFGAKPSECDILIVILWSRLYVGKANNIASRVWGHRKNLPLMMHLKNAKQGERIVRVGIFNARPAQTAARCLPIIERALIRYFLSEGHDLVNKQGTRLRRHEISSDGKHPNLFIPKLMFVDRTGNE